MRPADSRLHSIGATFAVHFHTALVQAPETLAALYTPTAHVSHCFRKASGPAEIAALLTSTTAANVKEVKLSDVATTRTPAGAIKVTITGEFLRTSGEPQAFTQEVELRELESNTFGITSDQLSHDAAAAGGAAAKWAEPEEEIKQKAPGSSAEPKEGVASRTSTPAPAPAPAAPAAAEPTPAAAAAPAAEPAKRPSSFAEALKAKKMSEGPAFSNKAVRVVAAGDKTEKTDAAAAADAGDSAKPERKSAHKKDEKSAGAAKPRGGAADGAAAAPASAAAAAAVVYYDIILKELAATVTEEEVRALVSPVAAVKLVNIVKSEKRRRGKDGDAAAAAAAATTITFAFVQIERPADAAASHVKEVVSKLSEQNKELHVEEVRERKPAAGRAAGGAARKPMEGGRGRKRGEQAPAAAAAAGATKAKAAGPAKAQ